MQTKSISLFVPGRLCLFGEHSDWAGLHRVINSELVPGAAIVTGIEQGIYAEVEPSEGFTMRNESPELQGTWVDFDCSMQLKELRDIAASGSYFSYVAGVASYIKEHYHAGGLKITITRMTLPIKSGLSSSAAICVLAARAFNLLYGLNLNTLGEMQIAFKGEQRTPSRCGRLDQACAFGITPVCIRFDGDDITVERLVIKAPLYWVFANLNAEKDTIRILSDLNKCYPFAQNEKERRVQEALGVRNQEIVARAIEAMKAGDAAALGALMTEAQGVFDALVAPASPKELAAPKLHRFLQDPEARALSFGGKGVGSQGDGSIQFLARDRESQGRLAAYLEKAGLPAYTLTIRPRRRIRKAIIPVAGYGTRLYPATRCMKKEMMPVIDRDGLLKPGILILLEQLHEAGIEEVCLITGSVEEWGLYEDFFQKPLSRQHREKLTPAMQAYEEKIREIGAGLCRRVQTDRRGFGHAVYQARDFAGEEPVLLLLGDTLYSSSKKNCSLQLMEAFETGESPLVAIHGIALDQARHYGMVAGEWEDEARTRLHLTKFVEKPGADYARRELNMGEPGGPGVFYAVFGQYVLTPEVFEALEQRIQDGGNESAGRESAEIGMTETLAEFIGKGLQGVVIDGEMHDIGNVAAYRETMIRLPGQN